jgi:hypothetical protein
LSFAATNIFIDILPQNAKRGISKCQIILKHLLIFSYYYMKTHLLINYFIPVPIIAYTILIVNKFPKIRINHINPKDETLFS